MPASMQPQIVFDGHAATGEGPVWTTGSRGLLWLDIPGERRRIIGSEEESFPVWLYEGRVQSPACGRRSGLASTHPAPRQVSQAGAMTMCPGTGLLSHVSPGIPAGGGAAPA